jgi:flagellar hook assembly protein FlgD
MLRRAVPNPFNPSTELSFELTHEGAVSLEIFDLSGRRVRTLLDGIFSAGVHRAPWDGSDATGAPVASGVYLVRVRSGDSVDQQRLVLLK